MRNKREHIRRAIVLLLAVAGLIICTAPFSASSGLAYAQAAAPSWSYTGSLNTPRSGYTATLLPNGKVLVTGGSNADGILASAELYNPSTGTWSPTGNLNAPRIFHSATLLQNGKVLVAGGWANSCCLEPPDNTAELYDPATGRWSLTGNLNAPRVAHTATLLSNGKVLFAGGGVSNSAELYNPGTGTWSFTSNLLGPRLGHAATLLQDGKVLVVGGCGDTEECFFELGSAELYVPNTGAWSPTGSLNTVRYAVSAVTLPNGNVLVAGGAGGHTNIALDSAELYSPATGRWSYTGSLLSRRYAPATLLPSGQVLIAGGCSGAVCLDTAELYDPATGNWHETASLNTSRFGHTATLLLNGKVLVVGGYGSGSNNLLQSAELYDSGSSSTINPIDDPQFFVRQQYRDFLGREPDAVGFQNWVDTLVNCPNGGFGEFDNPQCDRVHVSAGFYQSHEFQERGYWVLRFSEVGLDRGPTYAEFTPDLQQIGGSKTPAEEDAAKIVYTNAFVQRQEFQNRYAGFSNSQYVNALEQNAGVTLSNKQALIDDLNAGTKTRAGVLRNIVESQVVFDKFIIPGFVTMEYFGYLRRDVDTIGYRNWVDTLTGNRNDYRHMIFGFIYSTEYRQRFGQP